MQPNPALEQFLRTIPLFSLLEPGDVLELVRLLRPVMLEPGEVLFRQDEPGLAMWVLGEGVEVAVSSTPHGAQRPTLVARLGAGDTVGELALLDEQGRSGTAVVTAGGPAHQIFASDFHSLRDAFHPAAFRVVRRMCLDLCAKLRATREKVVPAGPAPGASPRPPGVRVSSPAVLEEFPPFRVLPDVVKLALAQKLSLVEASDRTQLFSEGELADGAYFVLSGTVAMTRQQKVIGRAGAGGMLGLVSAIDGGARSTGATTEGPARLLRLSDSDFDWLFARGNRFAFQLVDQVARQLTGQLRSTNELLPRRDGSQPTLTELRPPGRGEEPFELDLGLEL